MLVFIMSYLQKYRHSRIRLEAGIELYGLPFGVIKILIAQKNRNIFKY